MGGIEKLRVVDHAADATVFHFRDTVGKTENTVIVGYDDHTAFR